MTGMRKTVQPTAHRRGWKVAVIHLCPWFNPSRVRREQVKKGPRAALVNLPEQLEGAWGTEEKTKVGQMSLK